MNIIDTASLVLVSAALFAWINHRYIKLPTTIGIMLIALLFSVFLLVLSNFGIGVGKEYAARVISGIDFNRTLMDGMLSFLLFAGAMHVKLNELLDKKLLIGVLATFGVVSVTFIVGTVSYFLLPLFGLKIDFIYCLLFGSLIAPTDPVAVMAIMKNAGASKGLETKLAGESLFNDGVAVVVFLVILGIATGEHEATAGSIAKLFAIEALGGIVFGLLLGLLGFYLLKTIDNYKVEALITLALVTGGYQMALQLHTSGPIAVVVAGLLIGNQGRDHAMSKITKTQLDHFWELIDEILNALLFMLIGMEMIVIAISGNILLAGVLLAVIVLLARFISVGIPTSILKLRQDFHPHLVKILTWGGLRGGISVALALSLPNGPERDIIVAITYIIVVMSISIQGLTIGKLIKRTAPKAS